MLIITQKDRERIKAIIDYVSQEGIIPFTRLQQIVKNPSLLPKNDPHYVILGPYGICYQHEENVDQTYMRHISIATRDKFGIAPPRADVETILREFMFEKPLESYMIMQIGALHIIDSLNR